MVSFEERNAVDLSKNRDRLPFIVFFSLMALLAWKITAPLMMALMWSGMLAFTVMPLYKKINSFLGGKFSGIASVITLFIMIFSVIAPLLAILVTLGSEVSHLTSTVTGFLAQIEPNELKNPVELLPASFPSWARDYFASFLSDGASVRAFLQRAAQWTGAFLTALSKNLIMSASSVLFEIMVVLMTSFFFIRDGEKIVKYLRALLPLSKEESHAFFKRTNDTLHSIIFGILLTVAIQAFLGALGWWFVGLANPAFFGLLMFLFGMLPAGTAAVWFPGAIYLFLTGDVKNGAILLAWGVLIVGTIDNMLRPLLISGGKEGDEIPTLLIVLGLFGGLIAWGFLGIFLGPLVLVLFSIVVDIYRTRVIKGREQN